MVKKSVKSLFLPGDVARRPTTLLDTCLMVFTQNYIPYKLFRILSNNTRTSTSSRPEVFLRKGVLKMYSKFTGEHPCRSAISIKLFCNFIEIALRHGCSPVHLLHIFKTPFPKNTPRRPLLNFAYFQNIFNKILTLKVVWKYNFETQSCYAIVCETIAKKLSEAPHIN